MPIEIQFGRKEAADRVREDHGEHLSDADDKRLKKVRFDDDTPDDTLESIRLKADDSKGESGEAAGQVELTDREKNQIDFSEAPVMRARSHKAIFLDEGVTDWLSFWSEDITTNGEAREAAQRAVQDTSDVRLDADPDAEERAAEAAQTVQSEECNHARGHCKNGDMATCEFLRDECEYDDDAIESILTATGNLEVDEVETEQTTEQTELVTVGEGTADEMDVRPEVAGALRDSWAGYKAAISRLSEDVGDIRKAVVNARQASRAINAIRDDHGQDPLHYDRLHELLEVLEQMPGSIPETRTLEHFGADELEDTTPDPTPTSDAGQEQEQEQTGESDDRPIWEGQRLPDLPGATLTATDPPTYEFENGATVGIGIDADVTDDDPGRYFHKIVYPDGREEYPHERLTPAEAVDHLDHHADEALGFDPDADPDDAPDVEDVVDMDEQRDMSGNRVDPQATFTTGEAGPDDGEIDTADNTNPGGLMADERDMSEDVTERDPLGSDTTQGGLETFDTGGRRDPEQGGLGSFSGSDDSIETFQDAIDAINDEVETSGQRIPFDANMLDYFDSQGLDQTVWTESLSQDITRYRMDAVDVERRLSEVIGEHEQRGLLDAPADVDLYRDAIINYARTQL